MILESFCVAVQTGKRQAPQFSLFEPHVCDGERGKIDKKLMTSHRYADNTINMYEARALVHHVIYAMDAKISISQNRIEVQEVNGGEAD